MTFKGQAWLRFTVWLCVSVGISLTVFAGLKSWLVKFVTSVRDASLLRVTMWILFVIAFILGQVVRGILNSGWDVWTSLMGPGELKSRGEEMVRVAEMKQKYDKDQVRFQKKDGKPENGKKAVTG